MMWIPTPKNGYHFVRNSIEKIEEKYGAKYMGYWCTKRPNGDWHELPVDVFYQPNPDTSKGHTNYFGMYIQNETVWITEASSAFSEPIIGVICEDGQVLVSRYRHDYQTKGDRMIDGGRDYTRRSMHPVAKITVVEDRFIIEQEPQDVDTPYTGTIIARNDPLDEIMVEYNDDVARYKRVV